MLIAVYGVLMYCGLCLGVAGGLVGGFIVCDILVGGL